MGRKRKRKVGTVVPRGGRFGARVSGHWLGTRGSEEAAQDLIDRFIAKGQESRMTCGDYAEDWLVTHARPAASTRQSYRYSVNTFKQTFGSKYPDEISRRSARKWATSVPYADVRVARAMFSDMIDDELIDVNPFANLRLEVPQGNKSMDALSEKEIHALADEALRVHGPTFRAWILFAGYTGARPAEQAKVAWADIAGDEVKLRGTKTEAAVRTIVLPPVVLEALRELARPLGEELVFVTKHGKPFRKNSLHEYFKEIRGVVRREKPITLYWLRHAYATMLMQKGVPTEAIAHMMGHADHGTLVLKRYGHPAQERSRQLVRAAFGQNVAPLRSVDGKAANG